MDVSEKGLAFVAREEACALSAYWDRHHYAIGFGINDPHLTGHETITLDKAIADFVAFMKDTSHGVSRLFADNDLSQHEHDALCSLAYNLGVGGLSHQRDLMTAIADGQPDNVEEQFGLIGMNSQRRKREGKLYAEGDYGDISKLKLWRAGKNPRKDLAETVPMPRFLGSDVK